MLIKCFLKYKIDFLFIGDYILKKDNILKMIKNNIYFIIIRLKNIVIIGSLASLEDVKKINDEFKFKYLFNYITIF